MTDDELRELDDLLSWPQPIRRDLDRAQEAVREVLRLREEDRQWDKHSLVELAQERNAMFMALEIAVADPGTPNRVKSVCLLAIEGIHPPKQPDVGDDLPACKQHGTRWQIGCSGCSEAERLTEKPSTQPESEEVRND